MPEEADVLAEPMPMENGNLILKKISFFYLDLNR
jgi:hypothetical protein